MANMCVTRLRELLELINITICDTGIRYSLTGCYGHYKIYYVATHKSLIEGTVRECYLFLLAFQQGIYFGVDKM